ncbi:MAG: HD domain-containing protein [Campylobacterota bacterium]|nr:HD domain-containing protein [Campylobacterota bacterium]
MITLPEELTPITDHLLAQGCYPVVVGGYLRDILLQQESKDIDIEVYAVKNFETLQSMLEPFGSVNLVGKSFGVLKLTLGSYELDFALPRKESKKARGHRGFNVQLSGQMDFVTAALRRDFTINAIGYDINSSLLLDPYGGQKDLDSHTLRCVNEKTFVEDPLRILRAIQMAARFNLTCDESLLKLMQSMVAEGVLSELPKERLFGELKKLLLKAVKPSIGFELMDRLGILDFLPELSALKTTLQDPVYHPEGDVWTHTLMAIDAMASLRTENDKRDLTLMLAVLCHDFGKPATTKEIMGRVRSIGHEEAGIKPAHDFLRRFTDEKRLIDEVLSLVAHHQKPMQFYKQQAKAPAIRRLGMKTNIGDLVIVAKADFLGRESEEAKSGQFPAGVWLLDHATSLNVSRTAPKPLLQGRDLIAEGIPPSKAFKEVLERAFEAQLDGEFTNRVEAKMWLKGYLDL